MPDGTTSIPNYELEFFEKAIEGVRMPLQAQKAVQAILSHLTPPPLETVCRDFQAALKNEPRRDPETHLSRILASLALFQTCERPDKDLMTIAVAATKLATTQDDSTDPATSIVDRAKKSHHLAPPTLIDFTIRAGEVARSLKFGWNPRNNLVCLAGDALAWVANLKVD